LGIDPRQQGRHAQGGAGCDDGSAVQLAHSITPDGQGWQLF
jgi:hypothetical protein